MKDAYENLEGILWKDKSIEPSQTCVSDWVDGYAYAEFYTRLLPIIGREMASGYTMSVEWSMDGDTPMGIERGSWSQYIKARYFRYTYTNQSNVAHKVSLGYLLRG